MPGKGQSARGNSSTDWTSQFFTLPDFSGIRAETPPFGMNWATRQYAQGMLASLGLMETWIANSRNISDAWQASLREQQDVFLSSFRSQLKSTLAEQPTDGAKAESKPAASAAASGTAKKTSSRTREAASS